MVALDAIEAEDAASPPEAGPRPGSVTAQVRTADGEVDWHLPEEEPVALIYNRRTFAVMLASPADLIDFGLGFSVAEGVVGTVAEIDDIAVERLAAGLAVKITIPSARAAALLGRRRALEGRSGCGLCGIESLEALNRDPPRVTPIPVPPAAIARALAMLSSHQPMRALNHSVHGAAWADNTGTILVAREDVGRHTALDKLIGALLRGDVDPRSGFAVVSSRCGFELVQKAAMAGIGVLASVSAPTSLALDMARRAGMTLAAAAPDGTAVTFV